jgi:uncharacterized protein (TIGR03083 family)
MTDTAHVASPRTAARTSTLDRPTLMRLAEVEYDRFVGMLLDLGDDDWRLPTDCPGWDVRAIAAHALGMAEMAASVREGARQLRAASKRGGEFVDALSALQVEDRTNLTPEQIVSRFRYVGPRAARARRRTPALVRRLRMPVEQPVGDSTEPWTMGFLIDTILTRDPWMHRIDISRAVGRPPLLTPDHDGVVVADVVTEWAARHGSRCHLRLTGPAGGTWSFGAEGPRLEQDAVEFCRTISGREEGAGLLATRVPF